MAATADGELALRSPSEIEAGRETAVWASVGAEAAGEVAFAVLADSGDVLWRDSAEIAGGEASVTISRRDIARLPKGSAVVTATHGDRTVYAPITVRGRQFTDTLRRPDGLKTGDEILITDMSLLAPADAISATGEKGKWWLRPYRDETGSEGALVAVEAQDVLDPESTLAPSLELPIELRGWYDVSILTYAHPKLGGIDARLSDEPYFLHCDPSQAPEAEGRLVEIHYRAADLTGRTLVFQQPYGTYDSETLAAVSSLAGVRLVKLSQSQVRQIKEDRENDDVRVLGYDNDGFSYFWKWGVHDEACIARLLEPLRGASADFLNLELGGLGGITIPTPYTGMYQMTGHTRHGDYRANEFFRWCFESDTNIVDVLTDRAHELELKLFVSLMAERSFSRDATMREHPEWMIERGRGTWDYANPEVRAYQVEKIKWIVENHDIDGFIIDFTRYGHFFNADEPNKAEHMNQFVRDLRAAADEAKEDNDCYVALCASFGDESWHLKHWGTGTLEDQGLDPRTWIDEGIFDIIMPEGPSMMEYVAMAEGTRTEVWPRKVQDITFLDHQWLKGGLSMAELERGIDWALDGGAPGVFMFNHDPRPALGRVGHGAERELRLKSGATYGVRVGPAIEFASWHPDLTQAEEQRAALKPVTVVVDADGAAEGEALVPIRNTFDHAVTARVACAPGDGLGSPPAVEVAPGAEAVVKLGTTGAAAADPAAHRVNVEIASDGLVVLRHQLPLRAVPELVCGRHAEPLPSTSVDFGTADVRIGACYDDERLRVLVEVTGIDVAAIVRAPGTRDSRDVYAGDGVHVLIDTAGMERSYLGFAVTPAGGMAEYHTKHDPFLGHFARNLKWNGEWTADTRFLEDGFHVDASIPLSTLGTTPRPGDVWRVNIVIHLRQGREKPTALSWSARDVPFHLPRDEGTAFGTLRFE